MNERRRTLLFSGGYKIPTENGIYIESVDHKFYLTDDWDTANTANSIAVVADEGKFRIALQQSPSYMQMNSNDNDPWEDVLHVVSTSETAITDYDGVDNTSMIIKLQSSTDYAAGWCNAYTFPDGKTNGYLPACGELNLANQNKAAIDAALSKCGGEVFVQRNGIYWSSTFYGASHGTRYFWVYDWRAYEISEYSFTNLSLVRAFAPL